MNFGGKGGIDGQVNKVIDQAAVAAKQKIGEVIGGDQKKQNKQAGAAGIGNAVTGAVTKAAADHAANKAAEEALSIGKSLFG